MKTCKKITSIIMALLIITATVINTHANSDYGFYAEKEETQFVTGIYGYSVKNESATITKCDTSISGKIAIPSLVDGYTVTRIGNCAFDGCNDITSVIVPESILEIGAGAFCNCEKLTEIQLPNYMNKIETGAFYNCDSLKSIEISEGILTINKLCFGECSNLISVKLPDSLKEIMKYSFSNCEKLVNINLPDTLVDIEGHSFNGCTNLKNITIPQSVETIFDSGIGFDFYFNAIPNFKIYCYKNTAGEQYAIYNGFDYELLDDAPTTYTISYNANGGVGAPAAQSKTHDVALTLSSTVPTREGYKFLGWAESANAVSAQYNSGASFTKNASTELFAVWSPISYTVKFYDGANLLGSKTLKYDETGTLSYGAAPTKDGYKFTGWSIFDGGVATLKNGQEIKNLSSTDGAVVSYYAAWKAVENKTVTDSATGVSVTASEDTYNGNMTLKVEKVLSGSSFDILETVDDVVEKSEVFSIETYVDGVKTQPNGYVTVKIPVPSGFDKNKCELYYINTATKKAEPIAFTVEENYIVFKTNHFSDWAIVQTAGKVQSAKVDNVTLNYKKSATLNLNVTADEGIAYTVTYESSDTKVATVDKDGKVYAAKKGTADIKVTVTDQNGNTVTDTCKVTVKYSFFQWIIKIVLFGWIWY